MAVAKGQQNLEGGAPRKFYIGIGAVKVYGVNPTKKQLEDFFGHEPKKDPEYVTESDVKVGDDIKKYPSVRISFLVRTDGSKHDGMEVSAIHTFFLQKRYAQGSTSGKYQVIDPYGRTAWATKEEIQAKKLPMYTKKDTGEQFEANIDPDYRPAWVGEEALTLFLKNQLGIPNVQIYENGVWIDNPKVGKEECLIRLDHVEDYFKGNWSEITELLTYQPDNLVKIPFGVRRDKEDSSRLIQTTYTKLCFKNGVTDYSKLGKEIAEAAEKGYPVDGEFSCEELHEYVIDPSTLPPTMAEVAEANKLGEHAPW